MGFVQNHLKVGACALPGSIEAKTPDSGSFVYSHRQKEISEMNSEISCAPTGVPYVNMS